MATKESREEAASSKSAIYTTDFFCSWESWSVSCKRCPELMVSSFVVRGIGTKDACTMSQSKYSSSTVELVHSRFHMARNANKPVLKRI